MRESFSLRVYGSVGMGDDAGENAALTEAINAQVAAIEALLRDAGAKIDRVAVEFGSVALDGNGVYPPKSPEAYEAPPLDRPDL